MSYNLLKGKRGIIFGALNAQSIAWKVAERAVEEGAQIVLTNTAVACRMGTIDELAKKTNAVIIPADATSVEDLENLFVEAQKALGGKIDFVLHSCAMSMNMRKKRTYDDLDYSFLDKTLDISAISFHKMIQVAKKLDAIAEYGSILALTYVASHRTFFGYNDMADAKALLESIARSFGYIYGREKGVRVNTRQLQVAVSRVSTVCLTMLTVCLLLATQVLTSVPTIVWLCSLTLPVRLLCRLSSMMVVSLTWVCLSVV